MRVWMWITNLDYPFRCRSAHTDADETNERNERNHDCANDKDYHDDDATDRDDDATLDDDGATGGEDGCR